MKKIMSALAALMVLVGAFLFTGCGEISDALGGSDKWWTYEHQQEVGDSSVTLYFYFYYNTQDSYSNKKIKALKSSDFVKGLNVVIAADPNAKDANPLLDSVASGLSTGGFIFKTFAEDEKISGAISAKDAWSSFYTINAIKSDGKMTDEDDYPPVLWNSGAVNLADKENLDMTSILVNILVAGLK